MPERATILARITERFPVDLLNLACTNMTCSKVLSYPAAQPMREMLTRMVDACAQEMGYSAFDLMDAELAIEQAGITIAHLDAMPSDEVVETQVKDQRFGQRILMQLVPMSTKESSHRIGALCMALTAALATDAAIYS